jgi:hypothetical protein
MILGRTPDGVCACGRSRDHEVHTASTPNWHPYWNGDEETVDHPSHYGGADDVYETIKVIEAWDLGFCLGNAVKYISRAGKKDPAKTLEDLKKGAWYLAREIERLSKP